MASKKRSGGPGSPAQQNPTFRRKKVQSSVKMSTIPGYVATPNPTTSVNGKRVRATGLNQRSTPARQTIALVRAAGDARGLSNSERKSLQAALRQYGTKVFR